MSTKKQTTYLKSEAALETRFNEFAAELAMLSMRLGITLKVIGGVEFHDELVDVEYSDDWSSGDIYPVILQTEIPQL